MRIIPCSTKVHPCCGTRAAQPGRGGLSQPPCAKWGLKTTDHGQCQMQWTKMINWHDRILQKPIYLHVAHKSNVCWQWCYVALISSISPTNCRQVTSTPEAPEQAFLYPWKQIQIGCTEQSNNFWKIKSVLQHLCFITGSKGQYEGCSKVCSTFMC